MEEYKEFYQNNSIDTLSNKVGEIRSRLKSNPTVNNLPSIDWMTSLRNRLLHYKYTSVITLTDFTKFEIDHLLRCTLKVGVIVDGLVDLVYQLSSGNPFWVFEMAEFIQSIGPEEFIDAMTQIDPVDGGRNSSSYVRALETAHIKRNATFSFSDKVFSKSEKFNEVIVHPPAKSYVKPGKNKAGAVDFQGVEKASLSIDTDSAAKENRSGSTIGKSKLTLLIVYRLEKLSSDEQHILRTAAIIGYSFSRYILYGVLSSRLKAYMYDSLKVLLKKNWICASSQEDSEYVFNHPVVYNTLYDITPQSDRIAIHRTIADYLENMHSEDPNQYKLLCEQFSYCNEEKAFEYALKAAEISLSPPELDIQKAIDMLMKGLSFVKDEVDCNTITALIEYARDIIVPLDEQDDVEDSISEKISDERKAQVYVGNRLTDSATNPPTKFLFSRVQLSTNVVYPHTVEVIDGSHSCCFFIGMWPQQRKQSPLQVSGAKERVLLSDTESVRNESSSRSILTKRKNNNNVVIFLTPTAQECFRKQLQEIERKVLMKSTTYTSLHINKLVVNGKEYYNDIVKSKHFWQLKMLGIVSIDEDDEKSYRTTDTRFTGGSKVSKQSKDKSSWRSSTRLPFR